MNIFLRYIIVIGLAFFLVGCGTNDSEAETEETEKASETTEEEEPAEQKETILNDNEIEDLFVDFNTAIDEVEVYDVDMQLVIQMTENEDKTVQKAQFFGTLEESMENLDVTAIEVQGVNKNEVHMYKAGEEVYIKQNDADWVKTIEEVDEYSETDTSYENVANALESVHTIVEVVETEDTYKVKYAGNGNVDIFNAFEQPFSLTLTGLDIEKEAKMDLVFVIDKESKVIEDAVFEIAAEKDGVELLLTVNNEYDKINTATVGIPVEVIEEAN